MIKAIAELASKFPRQQQLQTSPITQAIQGMDRASLKLLLEKNGSTVSLSADKGGVEVVDVTDNSGD